MTLATSVGLASLLLAFAIPAGLLGGTAAPPIGASVPAAGAARLQGGPLARPTLEDAERARRNGDYDAALAILSALSADPDPAVSSESLLQQAVVQLEADRPAEATQTARALLARASDGALQARAALLLGRAQRAAGDCRAAIGSFDDAKRRGLDLGPYLDLYAADCASKLQDRTLQTERATAALASASSRLARVDALEHLVDSAQKRGDNQAALQHLQQLLDQAGTRGYRATTMVNIGNVLAALGRRAEAGQRFAVVVAELPETPAAQTALGNLAEFGELGRVGPDQAGAVRQYQGRYAEAEQSLASGIEQGLSDERAATARFNRGLALLQLGRLDEAVASLKRAADTLPAGPQAPLALLRAGRALERAGRLVDASDTYQRAAKQYPASQWGQQAQQHLSFVLTQRGAYPEAVATARNLAERDADYQWQSLALVWASKALARANDPTGSIDALRRAVELDRDKFGGLRSAAILAGDPRALHSPRTLDVAQLGATEAERAELAAWLGSKGAPPATLDAERTSEPGFALAGELYRLGMATQGDWELTELAARWANDAARLVSVSQFAADRGQSRLSLRIATDAQRASGQSLSTLPKIVQRLVYPLPYTDLIVAQAAQRRLDPLLLTALIRKESVFDPNARSSANALGLAQVIPSTGQGIARTLGRTGFKQEDLFNPAVSIEFGAYYLGSQLEAYAGQTFPALAAYNAGGGNVNAWLRDTSTDDMDTWAERIPFTETNSYVYQVYENYLNYRRLYGG